jgi:hypothetical protein
MDANSAEHGKVLSENTTKPMNHPDEFHFIRVHSRAFAVKKQEKPAVNLLGFPSQNHAYRSLSCLTLGP